jgi:hypothetical protein
MTTYSTSTPLLAATLDEPNASLLGLDRVTLIDGIKPYQHAALAIRRARRTEIPALFWRSRHREATGDVVGIFHDRKADVGLAPIETIKLLDHSVVDELKRIELLILG